MSKRPSPNMIKKAFKNGDIDLHPDKVIRHMLGEKKGSVSLRFYFFYTRGASSTGWAAKTQEALDKFYGKDEMVITDHFSNWLEWPKDSYFSVTFRPTTAV